MFYYTYILLSHKDSRLYIGYTEDVHKRFALHSAGSVRATRHRRPLELIYFEAYKNQLDAKKRETFLKSGSGHRFIAKQLNNFLTETRKSAEGPSMIFTKKV